jgi:hypothetical protein
MFFNSQNTRCTGHTLYAKGAFFQLDSCKTKLIQLTISHNCKITVFHSLKDITLKALIITQQMRPKDVKRTKAPLAMQALA